MEANEISPFSQSDLEAECIYLLDAYAQLYVLVGPVFSSQAESTRNAIFAQTLLFASEYAVLAASTEDRPQIPKTQVLFNGVPKELKMLFRHWEESVGLWGTGGLMAGSGARDEVRSLPLEQVMAVVCEGIGAA